MTTLYTMFSFQNAIDASDELCTMISQHKNTSVRSFLLTHARWSGEAKGVDPRFENAALRKAS